MAAKWYRNGTEREKGDRMAKQVERYITDLGPDRPKRYRVRVLRTDGSRPTSHHRTLDQARARKAEILEAMDDGLNPDLGMTLFRDVAAAYADAIGLHERRTMKSVEINLRLHVVPRWGAVPVRQITTPAIVAWVAKLSRQTNARGRVFAPKSVHSIYYSLRGVLHWAMEVGYVKSNPAEVERLSSLPKITKRRFTVDPGAVVRAMRYLPADLYPACLLAAYSGLRTGEIRGLRVSDVDYGEGCVYVERQAVGWTRVGEAPEYDDPKAGSAGVTEVPRFVLDAIVAMIAERGDVQSDDLVFMHRGKPLGRDTLREAWQRARAKAGITEGYERFHDLRSHAITLLLDGGMPLSEVAATARHSAERTTLTYAQRTNRGRGRVNAIMQRVHDQAERHASEGGP